MANFPKSPRTELSEEEVAAIKAKLPHLAEPMKPTKALLKALKLRKKLDRERAGAREREGGT